jgi:hypothetical protein
MELGHRIKQIFPKSGAGTARIGKNVIRVRKGIQVKTEEVVPNGEPGEDGLTPVTDRSVTDAEDEREPLQYANGYPYPD